MNAAAANVWRVAHLFMFLFFLMATYVQINDDDACIWMSGIGYHLDDDNVLPGLLAADNIFLSAEDANGLQALLDVTYSVIYAVPTVLTFALVINPRLSEHGLWIVINFIHTSCCTCFLIYLLVMLIRVMNSDDSSQESTWNILQYEEGREMTGVILVISWLKLARATTRRVYAEPNKTKDRISVRMLFFLLMLPIVPLAAWGVCFVDGLNRKLGHCSGMAGLCNKPPVT